MACWRQMKGSCERLWLTWRGAHALMQLLSSVLFLGSSGGPTVVLEQGASSSLAQRGFAVPPRTNALLCYPGHFLHGVLPGTKSPAAICAECTEQAACKMHRHVQSQCLPRRSACHALSGVCLGIGPHMPCRAASTQGARHAGHRMVGPRHACPGWPTWQRARPGAGQRSGSAGAARPLLAPRAAGAPPQRCSSAGRMERCSAHQPGLGGHPGGRGADSCRAGACMHSAASMPAFCPALTA